MKFYAFRGIHEGLSVIKEDNGLFYKGVSYSNGEVKFYQIPYLPNTAIELKDVQLESQVPIVKKDKLKLHKEVSKILSQKYSGYKLKTELTLLNDIVITVIFDQMDEELIWEKRREVDDYIEDNLKSLNYDDDFFWHLQIHVVTEDMWNSRRY